MHAARDDKGRKVVSSSMGSVPAATEDTVCTQSAAKQSTEPQILVVGSRWGAKMAKPEAVETNSWLHVRKEGGAPK